jgi:hypothetical protein
MNTGTLIVFIDSLPFYYVHRMAFLCSAKTLCELTPGFGYSINLLPELFSGLRPDEVGFFSEWSYAPLTSEFARLAWLLPLLEKLCVTPFAERVIRRLLRKTIGPTFRIPLRHLDRFARVGIDVYSADFPYPTIFTHTANLLLVLPYEGIPRQRDETGYLEVRERIRTHNKIFLALPDLDSYGHTCGVGTPEYDQKVQQLDRWLRELCEIFLKRYPDGRVTVVSDHGMANVECGYCLPIEDRIGPSRKDSYTFFLDSTLLRVWADDASLRESIHDYLENLSEGILLDLDERAQYGIKSQAFGDFIFVLNEGIVFQPSSLSNSMPKAMHGYHPELASQKGVFAAFGSPLPGDARPRTNVEVADVLMSIL